LYPSKLETRNRKLETEVENVPKIVRARLQRPAPPTADPHPDADLLTAFAEQSLAGRERDYVLEHLAQCGDCRDVVALALPATEAVAFAGSSSPARIGWLSLPVLRWGVVAAGIALVASFGILQYRQRQQEKTLVATSLRSQDRLTDSAAQSPAPTPAASASQTSPPQMEVGKQLAMDKKTPAHTQSDLTVNKPVPSAGAGATYPQPEPMRRSTSSGAFHGATGGQGFGSGAGYGGNVAPHREQSTAKQIPAPGPNQQGLTQQGPTQQNPPQQNQIQDQFIQNEQVDTASADHVGKAKPASPQASAAMVPAPLLRTEPALMKGRPAPRWTISANGALQRSLDGGKTWLDVDVAANDSVSANLLGGATGMNTSVTVEASSAALEVQPEAQTETRYKAKTETKSEAKSAAKSAPRPSAPANVKSAQPEPAPAPRTIFRAVSASSNAAEVWAGGSTGALYHTVDGGDFWTRVIPSDTGAILAGDVIGIQFSNPRNGIVTTSTAEVWTTLDAGQTWHKQR
jgi:hypothetical protein